jgi:hypothetical protein
LDKKLHFTDPWASIKDIQETGAAFSALKREYPALQKMKFIDCVLFSWSIFALLDPDPDWESPDCGSGYVTDPGTLLNPDPFRIHNTGFYTVLPCYGSG